jgi:hypothetical protein
VRLLPLLAALAVAACGGGADGPGTAPVADPANAARVAAATTTAASATNACAAVKPFYWEIGDRNGKLASGSIASTSDPTLYTAATSMNIASASKWLYASYFVQRQGGALSPEDIKFLTFRSGYTSFAICLPGQTVQQCVDFLANGTHTDATDGKFAYDGGHMEKHASINGLGPLGNDALAAEIRSRLGSDVGLAYSQPQLAGGVVTTADDYARFLRTVLANGLLMHDALGTHSVCTNPLNCSEAVSTPIPPEASWHYSIGHWVEDDPNVGDGAFSSAGLFGFYPWIDAGKTTYGIVARHVANMEAAQTSVQCGVLIRKAWFTASPQ